MKPRVPKVSKQGVDRAVHQMSHQSSSEEAPALPHAEGRSQLSNALALQIAGRRIRKQNPTDPEEEGLSDAEICGVWAFAWLPETSGMLRRKNPGIEVKGNPVEPLDLLDPFNLAMGAFVDGFARQPELVIKLLNKFRGYFRRRFGKPGISSVHSEYLDKRTRKEAAYCLAEAEAKRSPTPAAVQSASRRLRRHRANVESSIDSPQWPYVSATGADPVPKKATAARGQKR